MKKPSADDYVEFDKAFQAASRRVGKKQYTVPYFIASHPGSGVEEMIELARVPQAQRLQARPGAGLHPQPLRHRRLHVPHGPRPDDEASR